MTPFLKKTGLCTAVASMMLFSATASAQSSAEDVAAQLQQRAADLDAREAALRAKEQQLANAGSGSDLLPPNAAPGECYARVWVDAQYETTSEEVLVAAASKKIDVVPAVYETVTETVQVTQASSRLETIPAEYGTETEQIKVSDGQRVWRIDLGRSAAPASDALLKAAVDHGINLETAQVGMCFHEHHVPATYKTISDQVLTRAATEEVNIVPAQYEWVEEQVLVKEASTRLVSVAAEYGVEEEQIIDKPAHTIWKKGTGPIQKIDEATGEIMCLVEVPATYKTVKRTVLVTPARTETVEVPAEYKTVRVRKLVAAAREERTAIPAVFGSVERQEIDQAAGFVWHEVSNTDHPTDTRTGNKICLTETQPQYKTVTRTVVINPAQTREIEIPAEFEQVAVRKLVSAAREEVTEIPAKYRSVEKRQLLKDGYMAWRSVLCDTNMTRSRIADIQRSLIERGYNIAGGVDGIIGASTMTAVNSFQRENNLPVDRFLNIDTVKALGVSPN